MARNPSAAASVTAPSMREGLTKSSVGSIGRAFVARAIVEVAGQTISRAWSYLSDWRALEIARVPTQLRREILSPKIVETQTSALAAIRAWSSRSPAPVAPLVLCGGIGTGKSYGGARWLLDCRRRGQSGHWVSSAVWSRLPFDRKRDDGADVVTLAEEERAAISASAVVIDDLGAGTLSTHLLGRINALLLERESSERPTLVLLNANAGADDPKAWIRSNLDSRLLDRMRSGGGGVHYLPKSKSLRQPDPEAEVGRGKTWEAAATIVDRVGARDSGFDGSTWSRAGQEAILEPTFGWRLEAELQAAGPGLEWIEIAEAARRLLRLDPAEVARVAADLEESDRRWHELGAVPQLIQRLQNDLRRPGEIQHVARVMGESPPWERVAIAAEPLEPGERLRLAAMGISVEYASASSVYFIRFKPREYKPREGASLAERKRGPIVAESHDERSAWAWARTYIFQADTEQQQ